MLLRLALEDGHTSCVHAALEACDALAEALSELSGAARLSTILLDGWRSAAGGWRRLPSAGTSPARLSTPCELMVRFSSPLVFRPPARGGCAGEPPCPCIPPVGRAELPKLDPCELPPVCELE